MSPSEGFRATGIPASGRLSGTLAESTSSDKAEGTGRTMVLFQQHGVSELPDLHFLRNFEPSHPGCGSNLVKKYSSTQVPRKTRQLVHQTHDKEIQRQYLLWMTNEWEYFATDRPRCQRVAKVQKKVPYHFLTNRGSPRSSSPRRRSSRVGKFAGTRRQSSTTSA